MNSSRTSSWKISTIQKFPSTSNIGKEALITSSTRELVEFYWSNQKRFSSNHTDSPIDLN